MPATGPAGRPPLPSSGGVTSTATGSTRRFNVCDKVWAGGAKPGVQDGSTDRAVEAIRNHIINVLDVATPNAASPAQFYFPGSKSRYYLDRPIFQERTGWEYIGDGENQTFLTTRQGQRHPAIILGFPRGPVFPAIVGAVGNKPNYLKSSNWVDLYGKLDTTAASATGQRWGWKFNRLDLGAAANSTYTDTSISCPFTPASHGVSDGWCGTRQLTIDYCVDYGTGNAPTAYECFGMGGTGGGGFSLAYPFYLTSLGSGTFRFRFTVSGTNQPVDANGSPAMQDVNFSIGNRTGLIRITFQFDLATATCQAYVKAASDANAVQVAVTGMYAGFQSGNNMRFVANAFAPFNIGKKGMGTINIDPGTQPSCDHAVYGLCLRNKLIYQNNGVGTPQVLISSGLAPTDNQRYFDRSNGRGCVALFPMQDPPRGNANCTNDGRMVTIQGGDDVHGGNFTAYGYFVSNCVEQTPRYTNYARVADMTVQCAQGLQTVGGKYLATFGQAIAIGASWETHLENVKAMTIGAHGIGSLNGGANYFTYLDNITCEGGDAGYYGYYQGIRLRNFQISYMGKNALRFVGCEGEFDSIFFGDAPLSESGMTIHAGQFGNMLNFRNFNHDNETDSGTAFKASVVIEAGSATPIEVTFDKISTGSLPEGAYAILLRDRTSTTSTDYLNLPATRANALLKVGRFIAGGSIHKAQIGIEGTRWRVKAEDKMQFSGGYPVKEAVPMFEFIGPGGTGRAVLVDCDYSMPPRNGRYLEGAHILPVQLPQSNQPLEFRCGSTGTMNTDTPPTWYGANPVDDGTDGVAAYMVDNTYFAPITLTA